MFKLTVNAEELYNPNGSSNNTLVVGSTQGILPGMFVHGTGFTNSQFVTEVVNSTTVRLSDSPSERPNGTVKFISYKWTVTTNTLTETGATIRYGNSIAVSNNGMLVISDPYVLDTITGNPVNGSGKVYIYSQDAEQVYYKVGTITAPSDAMHFGKSVAISKNADFIAVSNLHNDLTYDGKVYIYKVGHYTSPVQILLNVSSDISGIFGDKISFANDYKTLVISSSFKLMMFDGGTTSFNKNGVTGFLGNITVNPSGVVDIFDMYESKWIFSERLAPTLDSSDQYGKGLVVTPTSIVVTAPGVSTVPRKFNADLSINYAANRITINSHGFTNRDAVIYNSGIRTTILGLSQDATYYVKIINSNIIELYTTPQLTTIINLVAPSNQTVLGIQTLTVRLLSGKLYEYVKPINTFSWAVKNYSITRPDVKKIKQAFLYNRSTNKLIKYLDVIDSIHGKHPKIAERELKFKSAYDPAVYSLGSISEVNVDSGIAWGVEQVGALWWDLRTTIFVDSYTDDVVYRNSTTSMLAPGASVDIYEWIETSLLPSEWDADADTNAGLTAGISGLSLYGDSAYTEIKRYDTVGRRFKSTYYYWVKNKTTIPAIVGRNMSAYDVSNLIANPKGEGYEFLAITGLNSFSLINVAHLLSHTDVVLSVEYWVVDNINQNIHTEWKLVSEAPSSVIPNNVEQKWIDSLCGKDLADRIVPDKLLPIKLRYGIENRPRQSMFVNRFEALKQYIEETNLILKKYLIVNIRNLSNLEQFDKLPTENQGLTDVTVDTYAELQFESANYYLKPALRPIIINGGITGIIIDFPGKGYANAPYINVHGNGRNAKIRAVIDTLGQIVGCEVLNKGEGYTNSTVLTVRNYSALVVSDEYSNNLWCIYAYEPLTDKWSKIRSQTYDVTKYWSKIDWYAPNYSKFTAINYAVDTYTDLNTLTTLIGEIVKIRITSSNSWVLLEKYANSTSYDWTESYKVVGSENGTIKFSSLLYSFINTAVGYDGMLYDTGVYDNCAGIEIRIILNAIKNDLLIDDLSSEYLKLFFTSVRYAMSEQTYIDWIFKTSFVNVTHNVGMLHRSTTYRNDNLSNFEDYVSEVKPYRTQVREYVSSYSNIEQGATAVSDFDMPPVYDHVYNSLMMINTKTLGDIIEIDNASVNLYPWKAWYDNVGFSITRLDLYDNGSGYVSEPKVTIVSNSGSGATARAFISSGQVSRIKLLTPGEGYLTTPTVIITGGVSTGGTPARASVQLGNSVVRSNLIKIKFDRITQTMLVTDLLHTDTLTNVTGTKLQFSLSWAPDLRIGKTTVRVNGSIIIRDNYKLQVVTSNLGKYSGFITFNTAPKANSIITVTYLKNVALLNAVDRIEHYYSPQVGDIGKDLAQLMSGIDYGGVVVSGLNFNVSSGWGMTGFSTAKWDSTSSISNYKVTIPKDEYRIQLPYVPEIGTKLNVYYDNGSGALPIRIDDPTFTLVGTNENVNAIMVTPIATGIDNIVEIPKWFTSENDSYTFIIRNENSDGSEETSDYDVSLNGGTFEYLSASGLLAEDLILDGDKFDSTFSGPEEVVPGQVVDTFAIKVYTRDNSGAFMQFKDMLNRVSYKRLSAEKQTTLVNALKYNDTTIVISDASNFETPDPLVNIPGVVYINGERIEFFTLSGSVLGQLRRGTLGTGIPLVHAAGSYVQELGTTETVPYIESTNTYQATIADGTVIVKTASDRLYGESIIVVLPFVPKKSKVVWDYRVSIPTGYGQCDDVEVYIGGYNYGSTWVSNAEYYINDVVTYGSYIYKCVADHISTTFTADFNTDIIKSKWTFFIGNIRLQKNPYTVYNERYVSLSNPTGEKRFPADYSVNGKYKEVRISNTFSLAQNTVITVVKKTGNIWTSNGPEMSFINAVSQAVI
jgi:hypothetical protein